MATRHRWETFMNWRARPLVSYRVIVDLIVHFVKANGSTSPKVFKLAVVDVAAGEEVSVRKTIPLAPLSTRTHYAGKHRVELQMNGAAHVLGAFTLTA